MAKSSASKKRAEGGFKTGNVPHNAGKYYEKEEADKCIKLCVTYTRLNEGLHNRVTKQLLPYAEDDANSAVNNNNHEFRLLRPSRSPKSAVNEAAETVTDTWSENSTYRLVHVQKNAEMWNTTFHEHASQHPGCEGFLSWDSLGEEQRGIVWQERARCDKCTYVSRKFKLYEEVETDTTRRGRKTAKANRGLQIGLMQTPIGSCSLRKILLSTNIKPPSTKRMQKTSTDVRATIEKVNKADMKVRRGELKLINKYRNSKNACAADIEGDGLFNNPLYSGVSKTPFQPATQCTYIMAENSTTSKQIVAIAIKNKLCSKRGKHEGVCGPENAECNANLDMRDTIGNERRWARECLEEMQVDGLEVRHITTDPDTAAYRAAEDLYVEGLSNTKPDHLLDTRHLSENVRKKIKNDKKLTQMMPAATKVEREKLCSRFALDMTFRCTAERSQATNHYKGDFLKIKSGISYTVDAIAHCYMGDHNLCKKYSLVCDAGDNNWIARSTFLPRNFAVTVLDTNPDDTKNKLRECVNLRLGQAILNKTKLNTNTQKSESANKILRRSVPRHTNFAANFPGRCHAGVHACNHGAAESIVKLCDGAGCPIAPGSSVAKCLKSEQTIYKNKKSYNSSEEQVQSKCKKRREMFDLYQEFHEHSQYQKGQLLPKIWTTQRRKKCEHSYAKEYK